MKKAPKILFIIGALFLVIGLGLNFLGSGLSPKSILKTQLNKTFTALKETLSNIENDSFTYDFSKDSVGFQGNLKIEVQTAEQSLQSLTKLNNSVFTYNGAVNQNNNQASINLLWKEPNQTLFDIKSYIEGKNLKLDLGDLYNKTITSTLETEIKDLKLDNSVDINNYIILLDKTEKITEKYINSQKVKNEKVGSETKSTYTIQYKDYLSYLLENYSKDQEVLNTISKISDIETKEVKEKIEEELKNLKEEENSDYVELSVYKSGLSFKRLESVFHTVSNYSKEYNRTSTLVITPNNNSYQYTYSSDGKELFHGEYNEETSTMTLEREDERQSLKASFTSNNDEIKVIFNLDNKITDINTYIELNSKTTSSSSNKKIKTDFEFKMTDNNHTNFLKIQNELILEKDAKVVDLNNTNETIDINSISEEEKDSILNKLYEKVNELFSINNTTNYNFRRVFE